MADRIGRIEQFNLCILGNPYKLPILEQDTKQLL